MTACLMLDVAGTALTAQERTRLAHPRVAGVILFARNYTDPVQLARLVAELRAVKSPPLLIGVDHEGGRVQRFREGFTRLPPMRALGQAWDRDPSHALTLARHTGHLLALELRAAGVDFSFTPVLDLDWGGSTVIGDRAFHRQPEAVSALAQALVTGMRDAGMPACGKHFPGHGHVVADSHVEVPIDPRPRAALDSADLIPFRRLVEAGIDAIMPAHVIYPDVDTAPAGFSPHWLNGILRGEFGFTGAIVSDDLCMAGARVAGGITHRVEAALAAGCDLALVCNRPDLADTVLAELHIPRSSAQPRRLDRLRGTGSPPAFEALPAHPGWRAARAALEQLTAEGDLSAGCDPTHYTPR